MVRRYLTAFVVSLAGIAVSGISQWYASLTSFHAAEPPFAKATRQVW